MEVDSRQEREGTAKDDLLLLLLPLLLLMLHRSLSHTSPGCCTVHSPFFA
jgi:hypothetical protein